MKEFGKNKKRIDIIDALRGFAVILMVVHHLFFDLVAFLGAPEWLYTNPVFDFLHYIFAGLFIVLSGVSSRFSRSNITRGVKVIIFALVISLITVIMDMPILFGILHLLGFSMVFYGLTHRLWNAIPDKIAPFVYFAAVLISSAATAFISFDTRHLWLFGWTGRGFVSYDYFPLFPWLFVFLAGTWMGKQIEDRRLPDKFYDLKVPVLAPVGRKSLIIYLLHQPVLYGIVWLIAKLFVQRADPL